VIGKLRELLIDDLSQKVLYYPGIGTAYSLADRVVGGVCQYAHVIICESISTGELTFSRSHWLGNQTKTLHNIP